MKNLNKIIYAIMLGLLIFTSCGENSKKGKVDSTINEKDSLVDIDKNKISKPSVPATPITK